MRKIIYILIGAGLLFSVYKIFGDKLFGSSRFEKFPVSKTFTVDFNFPDLAQEEFSDREKADQAKDWILYTLISNSGLKQKEIAEASFDLAPVRYGFNNSMANLEYGDTRSKFIGDGEVVALIPVSDEKKRMDNIGRILDETRKNQCENPKKAYVFEYDLNTEGKFAKITRKEDIDAETFFTEKMGYYESPIRNLEDLKSFMSKIDDITYANQKNGYLILGGRHIFSNIYGKATPEDVAAIWQSEKYIQEKQALGTSNTSSLETLYKEKLDSVYNNYDYELKNLEFQDGTSFYDLTLSEKNSLIEYVSYKVDSAALTIFNKQPSHSSDKNVKKLIAEFKEGLGSVNERFIGLAKKNNEDDDARVASASGFSLDPDVNFETSIHYVEENEYWFEDALQPKFTVKKLLEQLKERNGDLMQYAIARLPESGLYGDKKAEAKKKCMYQKARYDGKLQGTDVGMTLFYTDLLAKMWAANMFNSHPDINITGFKNLEQTSTVSPVVFLEESTSLPNCRLWFGPNKNGFQAGEGKKELIFARNSTQIFALSHDPGDTANIDNNGASKNIEVQAAKDFEVVLNWWNNHYEEVGDFEPQYQRLNEIMKWSTVIGWVNAEIENYSLDFLSGYPVKYDNWFPDWVKSNQDLKFNDWDKILFYKKGSVGNKTEAIPLLVSTNEMFSGGVSLAEKTLIKEAPELLDAERSLFRRANISKDYIGENSFKTFNETQINFVEKSEAKAFGIELKPKEGFKLRNRFGEIENNKFEWDITESAPGEYSFSSKFGDVPIGELRSSRVGENGFSIGFESQAIDKGMAIARQCSDYTGEIKEFLGSHPSVVKYFQQENGEWYVKMKNSEEWMVMKVYPAEAKGNVNLEKGWQARTSGAKSDSRIVEMKWVKQQDIEQLIAENKPVEKNWVDILDESPQKLKERLIKEKGKEGATAELKLIEDKGVAKAKEFAANGEFKKAALETEKLMTCFGETPALRSMRVQYELRAGLKELENSNFNTAANFMNEALSRRPSSLTGDDFFKDLNAFVENANISPGIKRNIYAMEDAYFTDKQLFIAADWEGYKPLAKKVANDVDLTKKGTKIFYPDNTAFRNIDPNAPFETIIGEIRSIPGVQIYDISAGGIGRNTRMYATFDPSPGADAFAQNLLGLRKMRFRVFPGSALNNCRDDNNDGQCDYEYTVRGPVYYITAPSLN